MVDMVSDTLTEAEAEPLNDTIINIKAKAVMKTPAETLSEVDAKGQFTG